MDIDIDIASNIDIDAIFKNITYASMVENGFLKKHPVGVYFQNIAKDQDTNLAAIPFDKSEEFGYKKIDFLHVSLLNNFYSKNEIKYLLDQEPDWSMLESREIVEQLFHISNHFETVTKIKPKSIEDLSDLLAIIRPNKIKLLDKYLNNKEETRIELHKKEDKSDLRKSHSIPYAMLIILNMHLLKQHENR